MFIDSLDDVRAEIDRGEAIRANGRREQLRGQAKARSIPVRQRVRCRAGSDTTPEVRRHSPRAVAWVATQLPTWTTTSREV